ncbi:MAG: 3-deoxy-8-phosphooctulonate synthase [Planctomycetes bacterium]|nr:3-deoxy-8-phosphooctulonate synthase [Planctomycetota bacterium]
MTEVRITDSVAIGGDHVLLVVAGPCVIEGRQLCIDVAGRVKEICESLGLQYVFKSSFDKANRTSISSFRGSGIEKGLEALAAVREQVAVPVLTDIHLPAQAALAAEVVDVLQIPAFLCRQTDLLVAAGTTGLPINVKKGQFMAPEDMGPAAEKIRSAGNEKVILCERGTFLGYHDLVVDMRSIVAMKGLGCPVLFDATHSVQRPAGQGDVSGGDREMVGPLAAAGVAAGADGVFLETHPDPGSALSDKATMVPIAEMPRLLERLKVVAAAVGRP